MITSLREPLPGDEMMESDLIEEDEFSGFAAMEGMQL